MHYTRVDGSLHSDTFGLPTLY